MDGRRANLRALGLSALVHLVALLATWDADFFPPPSAAAARAETEAGIELVLTPALAAPARDELPAPEPGRDEPDAYLDVPERLRAEEPPSRADFLALVDSRAADQREGGEDRDHAAAPLATAAPQLAVRRENPEVGGDMAVLPAPPAREQSVSGRPAARESRTPPRGVEETAAGAGWALPAGRSTVPATSGSPGSEPVAREGLASGQESAKQADDLLERAKEQATWRAQLGTIDPRDLLRGDEGAAPSRQGEGDPGDRMFEFDQLAAGDVAGNALLFGPYRLNTYEWNFAPWMQRFGQDLRRNWHAPYAYRLGVISGATEMKVVIERDGRLAAVEMRRHDGHESLQFASEAAVKGSSPFAPLPAHFPQERLEIILTLVYPDWPAILREQERRSPPQPEEALPRRGRR